MGSTGRGSAHRPGCYDPGPVPRPDDAPTDPPVRGRDVWVAVLLLISLGATAPYFSRLMNANERPRVLQAIAWVDAGELAVDGPAARGIRPGIDVARSPVDGRLYPNKPPGATLPAVVGYGALRLVAAVGGPEPTLRSTTIAARLLGGLLPTMVLLLWLVRRLRQRGAGPAGDAAVLLVVLATPLSSYARLLFGHSLAACLVLIGSMLVHDGVRSEQGDARKALLGGVLAASAIVVEYAAAFAGLPLAVLVIARWRSGTPWRVVLAAVVGACLPVMALAAYHAAVFGSPWATGYHHVVDAGFAQTHAKGLLGLGVPTTTSLFEHLLSPWGGLLVWAPLVAAGLGVALWRWTSLDSEERLATVLLAMFTVIVIGLQQTGGWRVGPRYLVLAMPLAAYGLVHLLKQTQGKVALVVVVLGVAIASTVLNTLAANLFPHLIPHGNPLADVLLPLAAEGRSPSSLLPSGWLTLGPMLLLPVALVIAALHQTFAPSSDDAPVRPPLVIALGSAIAAALIALGCTMTSHPEADGDLAAIHRIWEPDGTRPPRDVTLTALP